MVRGRCTTSVVPRFPSVVLPYPMPGGQEPGPFLSPPVSVGRTRGWPLVPAVRRLGSKAQYVGSRRGRNRARRYRRINNTGSHSYVKRLPCYARHRHRCRRTVAVTQREREGGGEGKERKCRGCDLPTVAYNSTTVLALAMQIRRICSARSSGSCVYVNAEENRARSRNESNDLNFFAVKLFLPRYF